MEELLRQLIEGADFDAPKRLLNVKADVACQVLPGTPYSIATQVGHMHYWQRSWLDKIEGKPTKGYPSVAVDFPTIAPEAWTTVRDTFLADLNTAHSYAGREEDMVRKQLMKIALHNAYHFGQIKLLKRMIKASKGLPEG